MNDNYKFNTLAIHGAAEDFPYKATSIPIVQSTSYEYKTAEELEEVFAGKSFGYLYSRISNPTVTALENRITLLEKGIGSIAVSSGMAAITVSLLNILKAGDHLITGKSLFGGTYSLFENIFKRYNIKVDFVDAADPSKIKKYIKKETKAIFVETIGNPKLDIINLKDVSKIARKNNIPFFVDNTIPTPYLLRAKDHGADIIIHSTTKFMNGHGNSIGGILIDTGNYNWDTEKFPDLKKYVKKYGQFGFLAKAKHDVYRDLGTCLSPFNAFLTLIGIETLGIRMEKHCDNALKLAQYLSKHPGVKWVNYPGLPSSSYLNLAKKQFNNKFCSILCFGMGTKKKGFQLINKLKFVKNLANLGDSRTLVIHPASTIYADFTPEEKEVVGVTEDMVRVSVGIEDIEDIISEFKAALEGLK